MSRSAAIRNYIADHPNSIANDVAKALGYSNGFVSSICSQQVKAGKLTRTMHHKSASNLIVHAYSVVDKTDVVVRPLEPVKETLVSVTEKTLDLDTIIRSATEQVASVMVQQVLAQFRAKLDAELQLQPAVIAPPKEPATYKSPTKVRGKRIGIIGLLPQQAGIISTEFGETFDLEFWNDDAHSKLKSMAIGCELVLVTKWAAHKTTEVLSNAGANWRKVHGAIDELRTLLTEIYLKDAAIVVA